LLDVTLKEQIKNQASSKVFLSTFHFRQKSLQVKTLFILSKIGKASDQTFSNKTDVVIFLVVE